MRLSTAPAVTVIFAGSGDAFGSGGRFQTCIHIQASDAPASILLDCGGTSLSALKHFGLDPNKIGVALISHLHGDHFGGLPFLILDGQFSGRTTPLTIAGPPGLPQRLRDAMECLFPDSSATRRRFEVQVVELAPRSTTEVDPVMVDALEVEHPSGAPPLALRLHVAGKVIAYTGDTAWTDTLATVASGSDLLIAECYYRDKAVPYHLRYVDLLDHVDQLTAKRIVMTHMSTEMLESQPEGRFEAAHDGLVIAL